MRQYPIDLQGVGMIHICEAIKNINAAFFDGFMTALLESPEEMENMTVEKRICYLAYATEKSAYITRSRENEMCDEIMQVAAEYMQKKMKMPLPERQP